MVEQQATSLFVEWSDGQSEWVKDIVKRSEYRVIESPKAEAIVGKYFAGFLAVASRQIF